MPKKYKLNTIKDIFDKIPADKIELCLDELKIALLQARSVKAACEALGESFEYPGEITWVNDDKGGVDLNLIDVEAVEKLGSFTVSTKKEPERGRSFGIPWSEGGFD